MVEREILDQIISPTTFIALAIIILMARDLYELVRDGLGVIANSFYQLGEALGRLNAWLGLVLTQWVNRRARDRYE